MTRTFLVSLLALVVFSAAARAERVYVSWQSPQTVGAYDLATGSQVIPPSFPTISGARGVAVSPLDGLVYVGSDNGGIASYNPLTGAVVDGNVGSLPSGSVSKIWGLCFDSLGTMYASHAKDQKITKLTPDLSGGFSANLAWGTLPSTGSIGAVNDLTVHDGQLYSARYYGVTVCDLATGTESWILETTGGPIGVAFDDSGTLYTANLGAKEVWKWSSDHSSHEVIGSFPTHIQDIDYYDGHLYVKGKMSSGGGGGKGDEYGVFKYDLSAASPTWGRLITAPGSDGMGFLDIAPDPIPEPGTMALLATGLIGLLCYAWRKRK